MLSRWCHRFDEEKKSEKNCKKIASCYGAYFVNLLYCALCTVFSIFSFLFSFLFLVFVKPSMYENLAHFSRLNSAENVVHVKGIRGEDFADCESKVGTCELSRRIYSATNNWVWIFLLLIIGFEVIFKRKCWSWEVFKRRMIWIWLDYFLRINLSHRHFFDVRGKIL